MSGIATASTLRRANYEVAEGSVEEKTVFIISLHLAR